MDLEVNGAHFAVTDLADLRTHLAAVRDKQWSEVNLGVDEDQEEESNFFGIIALVNGERSLLVYFRHDGDSGLTSRDSEYVGPPTATLQFQLNNGQVDEYPVAWTTPTEAALRALEYAFLNQAPAPWIVWHEE
jgi:hypothetical protein